MIVGFDKTKDISKDFWVVTESRANFEIKHILIIWDYNPKIKVSLMLLGYLNDSNFKSKCHVEILCEQKMRSH